MLPLLTLSAPCSCCTPAFNQLIFSLSQHTCHPSFHLSSTIYLPLAPHRIVVSTSAVVNVTPQDHLVPACQPACLAATFPLIPHSQPSTFVPPLSPPAAFLITPRPELSCSKPFSLKQHYSVFVFHFSPSWVLTISPFLKLDLQSPDSHLAFCVAITVDKTRFRLAGISL